MFCPLLHMIHKHYRAFSVHKLSSRANVGRERMTDRISWFEWVFAVKSLKGKSVFFRHVQLRQRPQFLRFSRCCRSEIWLAETNHPEIFKHIRSSQYFSASPFLIPPLSVSFIFLACPFISTLALLSSLLPLLLFPFPILGPLPRPFGVRTSHLSLPPFSPHTKFPQLLKMVCNHTSP
jgi:hypothetical protein